MKDLIKVRKRKSNQKFSLEIDIFFLIFWGWQSVKFLGMIQILTNISQKTNEFSRIADS